MGLGWCGVCVCVCGLDVNVNVDVDVDCACVYLPASLASDPARLILC